MIHVLPDDKLPEFLSLAHLAPYPVSLAVHLMLHAGLRVGELGHLAWSDLVHDNLPLARIRLDRLMTKNNQSREVPINRDLHAAIAYAWSGYARPNAFTPANFAMARTPKAKPLTTRTIERHVAALGRKIKFLDLTPHVLRHTFATRLMRVANASVVQQALGHRRLTTTQRYMHPNNQDLKNAVDRLSIDTTPLRPDQTSTPPEIHPRHSARTPEQHNAGLDPLPPPAWHRQAPSPPE